MHSAHTECRILIAAVRTALAVPYNTLHAVFINFKPAFDSVPVDTGYTHACRGGCFYKCTQSSCCGFTKEQNNHRGPSGRTPLSHKKKTGLTQRDKQCLLLVYALLKGLFDQRAEEINRRHLVCKVRRYDIWVEKVTSAPSVSSVPRSSHKLGTNRKLYRNRGSEV